MIQRSITKGPIKQAATQKYPNKSGNLCEIRHLKRVTKGTRLPLQRYCGRVAGPLGRLLCWGSQGFE